MMMPDSQEVVTAPSNPHKAKVPTAFIAVPIHVQCPLGLPLSNLFHLLEVKNCFLVIWDTIDENIFEAYAVN